MTSLRAATLLPVLLILSLWPGTGSACVGDECMQVWSTAPGGGALTVEWEFESDKVQTYRRFCASNVCFYNTIDVGFITSPNDNPNDAFYPIADGTRVRLEIVSADSGVAISLNGNRLDSPGEAATLGTAPDLHSHPLWQLLLPSGQVGDFHITYRLTTDSPAYASSEDFMVTVTNVEPTPGVPTPTATALPTRTPPPCSADCDDGGAVTVDELLLAVQIALGTIDTTACVVADGDGDGVVTADELVSAVNAALDGCPEVPPVAFAEIQSTIFSPTCAVQFCHDAQSATGNLVLEDGIAYSQLVGVAPDVASARDDGLLRVDPGNPDNSFLMVKLLGPPLGQGSRMPLALPPLTTEQLVLIRDWILEGAPE